MRPQVGRRGHHLGQPALELVEGAVGGGNDVDRHGDHDPRMPHARYAACAALISLEKKVSAVRVLVCCSPLRSMPWPSRNACGLRGDLDGSGGVHLVDSSRMRLPSG